MTDVLIATSNAGKLRDFAGAAAAFGVTIQSIPNFDLLPEVVEDGLSHSVRIGDAIDFEVEDIVPFGIETGQPVRFDGMFHPVASNLTMAEAKRSKIDAFGIQYEGKSGLSTPEFSWAA